jgi:hypothetical protein
MRKCVILTSIILFLPSMLAAQSGGARAAAPRTEHERQSLADIPIFATTATVLKYLSCNIRAYFRPVPMEWNVQSNR